MTPIALLLAATLCQAVQPSTQLPPWPRETADPTAKKPAAAPKGLMPFVGEYGPEEEPLYILEDHGHLTAIVGRGEPEALTPGPAHAFNVAAGGPHGSQLMVVTLDGAGRVASAQLGPVVYSRRQVGPEEGSGQLRVAPIRPVAEALQDALAQAPPAETGPFTPSDLVELVTLDRTIKLDIRYATTNNFLGSVFYAQPRAFLQRPAAEAVVRAEKALKPLGYGLLVHDGYRPWYVTKTFWDATPAEKRWLVANPADGSRHNRGAAVDLTLYDLKTGRAIEMPSTYDESTPRAYAFYPGGTSLQRWHRALLRRVMEAEGFTVNPNEWWHFDFNNWKSYAIGNVAFDQIR